MTDRHSGRHHGPMRRLILALSAVVVLTGCGGSGSDESDVTPAEGTIQLRVKIDDKFPLNLYANLDDKKCHAVGDTPGQTGTPPNITVKDGDGKILATQDAPRQGGVFVADAGCVVNVEFFELPETDIYSVSVEGQNGYSFEKNFSRTDESSFTVLVTP